MGYCELEDIKADFKGIEFNANTSVTPDQIDEIIDQESAYIDARVGLKYLTPVESSTYPDAAKLLKRICIFRVSERVRNILEIKSNATQQRESDEKYKDNRVRTFNDDLDLIVKGLMVLKDVPLLSKNGSFNIFDTDTSSCHVFDVTKDQW